MKIIIGDVGNRGIRIPKFLAKYIVKHYKSKSLSNHVLIEGTEFINMSHKGIIWSDLIKFYFKF